MLEFNARKCKVVRYHRVAKSSVHPYTLGNVTLEVCDPIMDLGVKFDSVLAFKEHVDHICSSASKSLRLIIRNSRAFRIKTVTVLYKSLV